MAFIPDIAFVLELLAFSAGTGLLYLASREGAKSQLGIRLSAYFIMFASVATMVCTGFNAYQARQAWRNYEAEISKQGAPSENTPESAAHGGEGEMCKCGMMKKEGGMKCPMMDGMKKEMGDDHSAHH